MKHTMRNAFVRWLQLHNEELRFPISSAPVWFGIEVRKNCEWKYINTYDGKVSSKRNLKGKYEIEVNDEFLLRLERPKYNK